ncbi:protein V57 [Meleagrid alphaherpesvirus 1]|uniref:protein V57 n=1 Tax=Meleagrid herpesvirus 1 TaxID=37108 RepID=UPI000156D102|nr:protein V57 [Meleagrid alphaherpesvirus 1]AKQ48650.1 protein V57 [iBAC vector pMeHV1-C7]AKQ48722.1 protein V57 [iBAC vector pMeHV1-C9]AKQ48794.1 protein V57 [iBAC vector pMeHV1-C10]AKQ48866.1 protein V57 [iBAC vector pMeHV1-C17]AKQ48938.1 protein V57 [iBAC vector pMeHV1-C18]
MFVVSATLASAADYVDFARTNQNVARKLRNMLRYKAGRMEMVDGNKCNSVREKSLQLATRDMLPARDCSRRSSQ